MKFYTEFIEVAGKIHQQYLEWAKQSTETFERLEPLISEIFSDDLLPENDLVTWYWSGTIISGADFNISLPWIPELCDEVCLQLEKNNFYLSFEWKNDGEYPTYTFNYHHRELPRLDVYVKMNSDDEGSTCKLVQVGTEIEEKPIWEVRC